MIRSAVQLRSTHGLHREDDLATHGTQQSNVFRADSLGLRHVAADEYAGDRRILR